jgi:isochorismate hydrolase
MMRHVWASKDQRAVVVRNDRRIQNASVDVWEINMFAIDRQRYCFWWMSSITSNFPTEKQFSRTHCKSPRGWRASRSARVASNIPVVYVNDNFGQWKSDAGKLLAYCLRADCAGKPFVEAIQPDEQDYCVLKPMHSAFFQTPLALLLRQLGASSIILAGITTNSCILCTAHDAKMRDFNVTVVADCCAARSGREHNEAIDNIRTMAGARVVTLSSLRFGTTKGGHGRAH